MYVPVPGFKPTSSVFLGESVTHKAPVADNLVLHGQSAVANQLQCQQKSRMLEVEQSLRSITQIY